MNRAGRRGALLVGFAVLIPWVAIVALAFATTGPPSPEEKWRTTIVILAVLATPSMIAVQLLWRAWWRGTSERSAAADAPEWLVARALLFGVMGAALGAKLHRAVSRPAQTGPSPRDVGTDSPQEPSAGRRRWRRSGRRRSSTTMSQPWHACSAEAPVEPRQVRSNATSMLPDVAFE